MNRTISRLFRSNWMSLLALAAILTLSVGCGDGSNVLGNPDGGLGPNLPGSGADNSGDDGLPSKGLIGGTETAKRPEIGLLKVGPGACTATLISSQAILTAKHCVEFSTCESNCTDGSFRVQASSGNTEKVDIEKWTVYSSAKDGAVPPNVSRDRIRATNRKKDKLGYWLDDDVAVVKLAEKITSVQPTSIAQSAPSPGQSITAWGFGCTERMSGGKGFGQKRFVAFTVGETSNKLCPGDSGGPVTLGGVDSGGSAAFVNSAYKKAQGIDEEAHDLFGDATMFRSNIKQQLSDWNAGTLGGGSGGGGNNGGGNNGGNDAGNGGNNGGADAGSGGGNNGGGSQETLTFSAPAGQITIDDNSGTALYLDLAQSGTVNSIELDVEFDHPSPSDLAIVLQSPDGTREGLALDGDVTSGMNTFSASKFSGANLSGRWDLEVYDVNENGEGGTIKSLKLNMTVTTN